MTWIVEDKTYKNKSEMFAAMREQKGEGGEFDCTDGPASYSYRITKYGYDRIAGETPIERRRDGKKR